MLMNYREPPRHGDTEVFGVPAVWVWRGRSRLPRRDSSRRLAGIALRTPRAGESAGAADTSVRIAPG